MELKMLPAKVVKILITNTNVLVVPIIGLTFTRTQMNDAEALTTRPSTLMAIQFISLVLAEKILITKRQRMPKVLNTQRRHQIFTI